MAANVPMVRQISWIGFLIQILIAVLFIFSLNRLGFSEPFLPGAVMYSFFAIFLRNLIAKKHRQGIRLVKQQKFADAIPFFEKSYTYFCRNQWVDKYRILTLFSASKVGYTETALCNIAFCYSQIGDGQKAMEYYKRTLKDYPDNGLAQAGLRMLTSMEFKT